MRCKTRMGPQGQVMKQWIIDALFFVLLRLVCQAMPSPLRFLFDHFAFKDNQSPGFSPLVSKLWRSLCPSPQLGVRALRLTDTWRRDALGTIVRNTGYFCAGGDRGGPWWPEGGWNGGVQLLEGDFHGHDCNTRHKSWNTCVIFPFPNVDLGITVVSLLQNTRGSTLGKDRGKLKWERRCQEWM